MQSIHQLSVYWICTGPLFAFVFLYTDKTMRTKGDTSTFCKKMKKRKSV